MKTRTVKRTRLVPHTIDGKTEMVLDHYEVDVPVPPRDWDRIVRTAVTVAAGVILAACVVWSTASIGDLLARAVFPPAAYAAALVFDLAWISCMALEWLARYDTRRADLPRKAGHVALVVAMGAVAAHGHLDGQLVIGIVGATVSGLAKGLWTVVLGHHAQPLDPRTQQWVDAQRAAAGGRLAMVAVRRDLTRADALVTAERIALGTSPDSDPDADPDQSGQSTDRPDEEEQPQASGPMTVKDAVRTAMDSGISDPDRVLAYVRTVADANAKAETVSTYIRRAKLAG